MSRTTVQKIEGIRSQISALHAERAALVAQPVSRAEVLRRVDGVLDHYHQQGMAALSTELQRAAVGGRVDLFALQGNALMDGKPGALPLSLDAGALLVALIGVAPLRKLIVQAAECVPAGVETKARNARLAMIAAELDALERDEEHLIVLSEIDGSPIDRRFDARPEIVLAAAGVAA
ncbi:hypothetical protein AWV79_28230 [Cupriavidus sp. UYMMa02A]|nr:hypothetical protein AWV79_28230 [Cupriavidus sp. UYMMa02A]